MKIISWNINGIRASIQKGLYDVLPGFDADIICLQETKADEDIIREIAPEIEGYTFFSSSAVKKGYSGTAVFTRLRPLNSILHIDKPEYGQEGRMIVLEYEAFYLLNLYVPNSGQGLKRLDFREEWDNYMLRYLEKLTAHKPAIITGDFNVAHEPIDLARPAANYNKTAGYTQREIDGFKRYLDAGYVDTFRNLYKDKVQYTFWNQRFNARANNVGWRIDYFMVSRDLADKVKDSFILDQIMGSDHCPIGLEITL